MPKAHLTQAFVERADGEVGKAKTDYYDTITPASCWNVDPAERAPSHCAT